MKTTMIAALAVSAAVAAAADTVTNGILSVVPMSATQGVTGLSVTFNIDPSALPPVPPATIPPTSAKIGSISGSSPTHVSQYVVTAQFNISLAEAVGLKDVAVTFPGPSGDLTYNRLQAFQVVAGSGVAADFAGSPTYGMPPLTVTFTNTSAGTITNQLWDFGDGAGSTSLNPTHVYSNIASYNVRLTVFGAAGSNTLIRASYITVTTNAGAYIVVDTGQTKCYNNNSEITAPGVGQPFYGQDAQCYGRPPSYTLGGDGLTVYDNNTGLTWQRSPDTTGDGAINVSDKLTWAQAQAHPAALNATNYAGYSDWRLPTIKELYSLIDFRGTDPSGLAGNDTSGLTPYINTNYFKFAYGNTNNGERIIDSQYWSSTRYVGYSTDGKTFGVNFADGRIKGYPGDFAKQYVICVRGNTSYGLNLLVDNDNQTISDLATGLMWSKADSGAGLNWSNALALVQTKNTANYLGHSDWRLPNAKELQSIIDYTRSPDTTASAAIDPVLMCTTISNESNQIDYPWYWSGTTHAQYNGSGAAGAYVCFGRAFGYMNSAWVDVHGAGCQRSDPKGGSLSSYTYVPYGYYNSIAPQGDAVRMYNYVRLVRDIIPEPAMAGLAAWAVFAFLRRRKLQQPS